MTDLPSAAYPSCASPYFPFPFSTIIPQFAKKTQMIKKMTYGQQISLSSNKIYYISTKLLILDELKKLHVRKTLTCPIANGSKETL